MALFRVANERAQFDAAGLETSDVYGAGIRFTQGGNARVTTSAGTFFNQGVPMSGTGQVAIVDATAGLPAGTIFHNGLPISGDKVCVSKNATAVVSNGLPFDSAGALAADINLDLNFIGTDTLNSSVTFTRASTATYFNSAGTLTSAAINEARFDYNPATLAARGLLIEEQRTNSLLQSEAFNTTWATSNASVTANSTTAPTATTVADTLVEDTATNFHFVSQTVSGTTNTNNYTFSCFIKASTRTAARIAIIEGTTFSRQVRATANLSAGTVVGAALNSATLTAATIQPVGNSWYRVTVTGVLGGTDTNIFCAVYVGQDTATFNYTGNGTGSVFVFGAQLEAGAFPTSYIPTTTTALTRSADVGAVNTLAPWFNATAGTLFAEYIATNAAQNNAAVALSDGTTSNRMIIRATNSSAQTVFIGVAATVTQWNDVVVSALLNTPTKSAFGYTINDIAWVRNGGTVGTDTTAIIPTVDRLVLGADGDQNFKLNGYLRRVVYYPRRLSNVELQSITS